MFLYIFYQNKLFIFYNDFNLIKNEKLLKTFQKSALNSIYNANKCSYFVLNNKFQR